MHSGSLSVFDAERLIEGLQKFSLEEVGSPRHLFFAMFVKA
jgi:hypothetical protein